MSVSFFKDAKPLTGSDSRISYMTSFVTFLEAECAVELFTDFQRHNLLLLSVFRESGGVSLTSVFIVLLSAVIHVWWNYLTKSSQSPKTFSLLKGTVLMGVAVGTVVTVLTRGSQEMY